MVPEDYLQHYVEPLQAWTGVTASGDWQALVLESEHYYSPDALSGSSLEMLNRADLLALLQQILAIEYPQQRLLRSVASEFPHVLQRLKDEWAWRQVELERLEKILAQYQSDNQRMSAELIECQTEWQRLAAELEHCQGELAVQTNEAATLRANLRELRGSTSWKWTRPLRWFSRMVRVAQAPDA